MSMITIAASIAPNIGIPTPGTVQGTDPDSVKIVQFVNETGSELARRVDWTVLTKQQVITSLGTDTQYALADDHMRLSPGLSVKAEENSLRGSLSADEWFSLTANVGTPRYFRLMGPKIGFYPYPRNGNEVIISYQSKEWAKKNNGTGIAAMAQDNDVAVIPEALLAAGAIWRWYRHVGRDFSDYLAEYETMLSDLASAEGGVRSP